MAAAAARRRLRLITQLHGVLNCLSRVCHACARVTVALLKSGQEAISFGGGHTSSRCCLSGSSLCPLLRACASRRRGMCGGRPRRPRWSLASRPSRMGRRSCCASSRLTCLNSRGWRRAMGQRATRWTCRTSCRQSWRRIRRPNERPRVTSARSASAPDSSRLLRMLVSCAACLWARKTVRRGGGRPTAWPVGGQ